VISFQIILEEQNEDLNAKLQTLNLSQTSQGSKQLYQTMTDIKLQNVSFIVYAYVYCISLSTVLLNSRNWPKKWRPKFWCVQNPP